MARTVLMKLNNCGAFAVGISSTACPYQVVAIFEGDAAESGGRFFFSFMKDIVSVSGHMQTQPVSV